MNLDFALEMIEKGNVAAGVDCTVQYLQQARRERPNGSWKNFIAAEVLPHPISAVLHRDPFTRHSFQRPRGYPGDAGLIDYLYGYGEHTPAPGSALAELHRCTTNSPAARAVRYRRSFIAQMIDSLAATSRDPLRVLSIAAGHLREADLSAAVQGGQIGDFIALDQDKQSVALIDRCYGKRGVTAVEGSVRGIIGGTQSFAHFDFVYASGLFDYLSHPVGSKLLERMFAAVRPGGQVLIVNFLRDIPDAGYMESFMDWHLIYRTDAEMLDLTSSLPREQIGDIAVSHDPDDNVVVVAVKKRDSPRA